MGAVTGEDLGPMTHELTAAPSGWCWVYRDGQWLLVPIN